MSKTKETPNTGIKSTDWRTTQKFLRVAHNKSVVAYFKQDFLLAKINLRNSLLINKKDSAIICLNKMHFYEQYIRLYDSIMPVIPDWWQLRKGANVPQLVVIFKPKKPTEINKRSRWNLTFPHFSKKPEKAKLISGYSKGAYQAMLTFKDNSKLIIYAESLDHAESTIKKWVSLKAFNSKFLNAKDYDLKLGKTKKDFQEIDVVPCYAKYFSQGLQNIKPDWVIKLD